MNAIRLILATLLIVSMIGGIILIYQITEGDDCRSPIEINDLPREAKYMEDIGVFKNSTGKIIDAGDPGDWDENIREIGNVVIGPDRDGYFFFYSGYQGEYRQDNVFVGMAHSNNGSDWIKHGKILDTPAEDPFVIVEGSRFYMFYEDKEDSSFRRLSLSTSVDGFNWSVEKKGVINPVEGTWQRRDVSSPAIIRSEGRWTMLYEGRGGENLGKIGRATSVDLINWSISAEPVYGGEFNWEKYVVPDDITYRNSSYYLTYHAYGDSCGWQTGIAFSKDLVNWAPLNEYPVHSSSTVMIVRCEEDLRFYTDSGSEVEYLTPLIVE